MENESAYSVIGLLFIILIVIVGELLLSDGANKAAEEGAVKLLKVYLKDDSVDISNKMICKSSNFGINTICIYYIPGTDHARGFFVSQEGKISNFPLSN